MLWCACYATPYALGYRYSPPLRPAGTCAGVLHPLMRTTWDRVHPIPPLGAWLWVIQRSTRCEVLYIPTSIPVRACRVHTHLYHVPYHDMHGALMRQTHLRRALPGLLPGRILEMQMLWSRMGAGSLVQRYTYRYGDIPDTV